jgi:hypothetical protein
VLALFLKLPAGKGHLRTFRLHYRAITMINATQNIQTVTALVLLLPQSVVRKPVSLLEGIAEGRGKDQARWDPEDDDGERAAEGESCVVSVATKFAQSFLERCGKKKSGSEFRPCSAT